MAVAPFRQRRGGEVRGALCGRVENTWRERMEGGHRGGVPATIYGPEGPRRGSVLRHAFEAAQRYPEPSGRRHPSMNDRATHPAGGRRHPGHGPLRVASRDPSGKSGSGRAALAAEATQCVVFDGH